MSKVSIIRAGMAAAVLAMSPAAFAQENNAVIAEDPAMNTTADPLATNVVTNDPLATDPLATTTTTTTTTDPLATDPMLNATDDIDDDDDRSFPWGLLGLLGLAGLLGVKRRDDEVRVDTRDTR